MTAPVRATTPRGAWLVVGGALLWGTTGTAQALGPTTATPLAVGSTRLVLGGALLVLWSVVERRRRPRPPARATAARGGIGERSASGGTRLVSGLIGAVGVAAYQVTFFNAVERAGVALGTAVAIGSSPVFTGLFEWALTRRPPRGRWWAATAVGTAGVVLLAGPSRLVPSGVALALAAGASYAAYAIASKSLLDAGVSGPDAMAVVFGGGAALVAPALLLVDLGWSTSGRGVAVVAWLGVVTVLVAYLLFAAGLAAVPASTAATLSLTEPLTAAVLGLTVLGERPTAIGLIGASAILLALVLLVAPAPRRRAPANPLPR